MTDFGQKFQNSSTFLQKKLICIENLIKFKQEQAISEKNGRENVFILNSNRF